jgi:acetoin utilization deacetylase AcuC-like enzyme
MSFVAWHPIFKHPLPEDHRFPMNKYDLLHDQLLYQGVVDKKDFFEPEILDVANLEGVHSPDYYNRLFALNLTASEIRRIGFPLSHQLVECDLRIAEGTIRAAIAALQKGIGYNIAGGTHHAGSNWGEGFCLLNDRAIAAHYLLKNQGIEMIAIIDLDVHQGNGTAEIFKSRDEVFTFSMHGKNNFPFKKEISDMDVHLPDGINGAEYLAILKE